jgi:hypothetical protein
MPNSALEIQFRLYTIGRQPGEGGPSAVPPSGTGCLPRVTQVMALAIHFQDMIQRGDARDYADLARLGCLTRERISQIMELLWLAPDIQQEILYLPTTLKGHYPISELAVRRIANSLSWPEQRQHWRMLKQTLHLE